jgi:hypothetical protein
MNNLNKHDRLQKAYIRAEKELHKIWEQMRGLPYRKLETPYQSGWKLSLALRDDIGRSKKAEVLLELLKKFAVTTTTRSSKLVSKVRRNPAISVFGIHTTNTWMWQIKPDVRSITKKEYEKLTVREAKYFYFSRFSAGMHRRMNEYHFDVPQHYLVVKVDKRLVTHVQDIDPELVRREAELKAFLDPYWRSFPGYGHYSNHYNNRRERRKTKMELSQAKHGVEL